jgi:hypothetical protein
MDRQTLSAIADISSLLGLLGFIPVLIQLFRTKKSADAAKESARKTLEHVANVVAVVSIEQICSRSREISHLTRARNYKAAAMATLDLRETVAKFKESKVGMELQPAQEWSEIWNRIYGIQFTLERGAEGQKADFHKTIMDISDLLCQFSSFASILGVRLGEKNVYS